jgi:hypothetical protein
MGRPSGGGDPNQAAEQQQALAERRLQQQNARIQQQQIQTIRRGSGAPSIGTPILPISNPSGKVGSVPNTFGSAQPSASLFSKQKLGG